MAHWKSCLKADGSTVMVNLERATTVLRVKDRTRITFDNNNTIEVQDDLERLLQDTGGSLAADRT